MRHGLYILLALLVGQAAQGQTACSLKEITDAASKAGSEAVSGKAITDSHCLRTRTKSVNKPVPKPTPAAGKSADDSSQSISTVVSPIIIVTGAQQPIQQRQTVRRASQKSRPTEQRREVKPKPEKVYIKQIVRVKGRAKKNTISAVGGMAPTKVSTSVDDNEARVKTELGPVFGVQYQRHFDNDIVVGVGVLSNTTLTVSVGLDF